MTIRESNRQIRESQKWLKLHPEFPQNKKNARAIGEVIRLNDLNWTFAALEVAYQILKLKKYKFLKEKK